MKLVTILIISLFAIAGLLGYFFMNPDKGDNFSNKAINIAEETPGKIDETRDNIEKTKEAIGEVSDTIKELKEIFGDDLVECLPEQRYAEACIEIYEPVCAYVEVQCVKAPCDPVTETYENSCKACSNSLVAGYVEGEC